MFPLCHLRAPPPPPRPPTCITTMTLCFACTTGLPSARQRATRVCRRRVAPPLCTTRMSASDNGELAEEELRRLGAEREMARMRARLAGLFGSEMEITREAGDVFDGKALRELIKRKWGVQFDLQPMKIHGRVYLQIMWRYFEQQSFYLGEDEFGSHCEAVAILLNDWGAVDYFIDYVCAIKKRPVVGICLNVPIPNISAAEATF